MGGTARPDELFEEEFLKETSRMAEAKRASGRGTNGGGNARKMSAEADPSPTNSEPRSDTEGDASAADPR